MADSLRNLFPLHQKRPKGNPKTIGFWRRFCPLLPLLAKAGRSGERNIPAPKSAEHPPRRDEGLQFA